MPFFNNEIHGGLDQGGCVTHSAVIRMCTVRPVSFMCGGVRVLEDFVVSGMPPDLRWSWFTFSFYVVLQEQVLTIEYGIRKIADPVAQDHHAAGLA